MKKSVIFVICICILVVVGCQYDNYEEPTSTLSGKVVYEGKAVGIRTNGVEMELWQYGFGLRKNIPIYVAHDGSYSVSLFDGQYKMVRKAGAPWQPQLTDTITVDVRNNTVVDVPIIPYFVISNESFQKGTGTVTAKFTINKVVESANLRDVKLYLGKSILTDENKKEAALSVDISNITLGQETTITGNVPADLAKYDYIYVRVGVRSTVSNEFYYTQVQKINLK